MSYYMAARKHRKAFLEARQSLEVKMNLEEQSQQQVRLRSDGVYKEKGSLLMCPCSPCLLPLPQCKSVRK